MLDQNAFEKIIEAGIQAPSGENAQPWKFKIKNSRIYLFNRPDRDSSLYNFKHLGSFVSHGAVLENMDIAASQYGYKAVFALFPDKEKSDLVAIIQFEKSNIKPNHLYPYIFKRATNRKPYHMEKTLNKKEKDYILSVGDNIHGSKVLMIEDREKINLLAAAASMNERAMLENHFIHQFFFGHVRWTDEENRLTPDGFYLKTLELKPPQTAAFKLFRHWKILAFFNKILGVSEFVAKENSKIYSSSSAMIAVIVPGDSPDYFISAGRATQNIWLKITELGLSLQPLTGVLFLMKSILAGKTENFSKGQIEFLSSAYRRINDIFSVKDGSMAMLLRVGDGGEPTARSTRFPLTQFIEKGR